MDSALEKDFSLPRSVYFFTFHKCASTLFSDYILPNVPGLAHVDIAALLDAHPEEEVEGFAEYGKIYGPIRLTANSSTPVFQRLVAPTSEIPFVQQHRCLFFVRDPRDILVSEYFSFGWSHSLSEASRMREHQETTRALIVSQTVEEYALMRAPSLRAAFAQLLLLAANCGDSLLLRYEDLVDDFPTCGPKLGEFLHLPPDVLRGIEDRARPPQAEDVSKHKRSGKPGSFATKLSRDVAAKIDDVFADILPQLSYRPSSHFYRS